MLLFLLHSMAIFARKNIDRNAYIGVPDLPSQKKKASVREAALALDIG